MAAKARGARARTLGWVLAAALGAGELRELPAERPESGPSPAGIERAGVVRVLPLALARARLCAAGCGQPARLDEGEYAAEGCAGRVRPLPLGARRVLGLPIDLESLSAEEFEDLPGIGPALARRIVETRRLRGGLRELEELLEVPGIGPARLEAVRRALHREEF